MKKRIATSKKVHPFIVSVTSMHGTNKHLMNAIDLIDELPALYVKIKNAKNLKRLDLLSSKIWERFNVLASVTEANSFKKEFTLIEKIQNKYMSVLYLIFVREKIILDAGRRRILSRAA